MLNQIGILTFKPKRYIIIEQNSKCYLERVGILDKEIVFRPGNQGKDCPGNGKHIDANGNLIECCCDECDFLMCCFMGQKIPHYFLRR